MTLMLVSLCVCLGPGALSYYSAVGSPVAADLSYLSLLTNAATAMAAAAAAAGVHHPTASHFSSSQLVPGHSPFPSPSSAGCCTPGVHRLDVSPLSSNFDFSSPPSSSSFHASSQPPPPPPTLLSDLHKGISYRTHARTLSQD